MDITNLLNYDDSIASYSRKSRDDDGEDTLEMHRNRLANFIEKQGFTNVDCYEEVASGGSISGRPEFQKLLKKVKESKYKAVIVVDFDRLSRGDTYERGVIERAFKESKTLILTTRGEVIDYSDSNQVLNAGVKGMLANFELEQTKYRMKEGKKSTVLKGTPHSGNPPYGYNWDRNLMQAIVNEEEKKIFKLIVNCYINDEMSAVAIADKLNEMKVPSPRNGFWNSKTIYRLLRNEFHLGFVVHGKYKSLPEEKRTGHGTVYRYIIENPNKDEIIIAKGKHEPIITEEEHAKILKRSLELNKYNNKNVSSKNRYRLSSLVKCPHCDKTMNVSQTGNRDVHVRKCLRKSQFRTLECDKTIGISESILYEAVISNIKLYRQEFFQTISENDSQDTAGIIALEIEAYENSILKSKKKIAKSKEMFAEEIIDMQELKQRIFKEEANILDSERKLSELKLSYNHIENKERMERIENWSSEKVESLISDKNSSMSNEEINMILKSILLKISYTINDENKLNLSIDYR
ncbi:recombinase family protein [Lysinibacillus sp. M3]|uniref:Recombinase family protein n=1 Tax=Lysinibacillus zambalensis TaxID=3160866 RepID=A0ABV1MVL1_9BACI